MQGRGPQTWWAGALFRSDRVNYLADNEIRKEATTESTPPPLPPSPSREQMRTSWVMKGIKRSPDGGYLLAFDTPQGPKRLEAKVAVCTAPAHRLSDVEGLRVSERSRSMVLP